MTKGKPSFGKRNKPVHMRCRRCGKHTYHISKRVCASCGFGKSPKLREYAWQTKIKLGKERR